MINSLVAGLAIAASTAVVSLAICVPAFVVIAVASVWGL